MAIVDFPPIEMADEHGLLAVGGDVEIPSLLLAYSRGIFPWPITKSAPLAWFSPDPRGVLFYDDIKVGRTLKKWLNRSPYTFRINHNFPEVIKYCSKVKRTDQKGTWITSQIIDGYTALHQAGHAYCVEAYADQKLVGGIYGVNINSYISGESMFFLKSNASKLALLYLMEHLAGKGIKWLDTQMITPVVKDLGGCEIPRTQFIKHLTKSLQRPLEENLF